MTHREGITLYIYSYLIFNLKLLTVNAALTMFDNHAGEELYGSMVYNPDRILVLIMERLEDDGRVLDTAVQTLLNETTIELVCASLYSDDLSPSPWAKHLYHNVVIELLGSTDINVPYCYRCSPCMEPQRAVWRKGL